MAHCRNRGVAFVNVSPVKEDAPEFLEAEWRAGHLMLPIEDRDEVPFESFRADPEGHPLPTPSGRIEIFSEAVASFDYDDCPGHPTWLERHGNPNVLTRDRGTSRMAQGPTAHTALVEMAPVAGTPPAVGAFCPPAVGLRRP